MTAQEIAAWCDEEYRRIDARPYAGETYGEHERSGRLRVLAEIAAMIRCGVLARHSAVSSAWAGRAPLIEAKHE